MNIVDALGYVVDRLIAVEPTYFGKGNTFVVPTFREMPQLNRWYAEVWYAGTTRVDGTGGSNMDRRYIIGLGVGTRLHEDMSPTRTAETKELILLLRRLTNWFHMYYNSAYFVEPLSFASETGILQFEAQGGIGLYALQGYHATDLFPTYDQLKADLPALYPRT
jgi:hypothetical protein